MKILIYGANGFVGAEISRLAQLQGFNAVIAGRNKLKISSLAKRLNLDYRVFSLKDYDQLNSQTEEFDVFINCAGPYIETYEPIVLACIKNNTHYLDLSGEIPVYEGIQQLALNHLDNTESMLLPGIGFDVAVTDCLALQLKEQLPTGNNLVLAFKSEGPSGLPPGTVKTMVSLIPYGNWIRKNGNMIQLKKGIKKRRIQFKTSFDKAFRITWGDIYTAYYSTKIPNIEVYASFPPIVMLQLQFIDTFRKVLSRPRIMRFLVKVLKGGSTAEQRRRTTMYVYGELTDKEGNMAVGRIIGPEGGFTWTSRLVIEALKQIKRNNWKKGYQTPASAFGSSFIHPIKGVQVEAITITSNQKRRSTT